MFTVHTITPKTKHDDKYSLINQANGIAPTLALPPH